MRPTLFALPLLVATVAVAQNATQQPDPKIVAKLQSDVLIAKYILIANSCPVGMTAQRRDFGQTLWLTSSVDEYHSQKPDRSKPYTTGVHVELNSYAKASIRQVTLVVYYVAPGTRALPVTSNGTPPDLRKTFDLSAENGAASKLAGDLLIGHSAGITRVHLVSIDYTDGTSWHAPRESACSIEPSRFILINAH